MTLRRTFAVIFTVLSVAGFVAEIVLESLAGAGHVVSWGFAGVFLLFVLVGALVVLKQPYNLVGWLLLAVGVLECLDGSGIDAYVASASGGWRTVGRSILAWGEALDTIGPGIAALMLLFFPTGSLLPRKRWRFAVVATVIWMAAVFVVTFVGQLASSREWTAGSELLFRGAPALLVLGVVAIVVRFRRSRGDVRAQLEWVGFSAALIVVGLGSLIIGSIAGLDGTTAGSVVYLIFLASLVSMPLAIGVAILRHRLFDIDRLISRTVGYTIVTVVLAGAYLGIVLTLGAAARALGSSSDLAVAVSTLAVAALFQPVRLRVQDLVDRRFNRRRYDTVRTVEEFGATLRDEVKLAHLATDLRHVVGATLAPAHASVWLAAGDP